MKKYFALIAGLAAWLFFNAAHAQDTGTIVAYRDSIINSAGIKVKFVPVIKLLFIIKHINNVRDTITSDFFDEKIEQRLKTNKIPNSHTGDSIFIYAYNPHKDVFTYSVKVDDSVINNNQALKTVTTLVSGIDLYHKYTINVKDANGKEYFTICHNNYPFPAVYGIYFPEQRDSLLKAITLYALSDSLNWHFPVVDWKAYGNIATGFDSIKSKRNIILFPSTPNIFFKYNHLTYLMGNLPAGAWYQYRIVSQDNLSDTGTWINNAPGSSLIDIMFPQPGSYSVDIRFCFPYNNHVKSITHNYITLRPAWYQTRIANFSAGFVIGLSVVFIPFGIFLYFRKRKKKLNELKHKMAELQLQSYRNQLNPHFIFNALSSIQSLINKNDADNANTYLTEFSTLLRMTLDPKKAEHWTLEDELQLLDRYIHLEQLRFQFKYTVQKQDDINIQVIFPAMLLQPIVENAIKHGISKYQEQGALTIRLNAKKENLMITISDNGSGFNIKEIGENSHGIRLTKERIAFLNETNREQSINLTINCAEQGTQVILHFNHYLHG